MARKINDVKVSKDFKLYEFECHDGNHQVKIDPELIERLQKLRDYVKKPIQINSGYRTEEYNRKIGGVGGSQHVEGKASDIVIKGYTPSQVFDLAKKFGFRGIGLYDTFTHVDVRSTPSYWDYRGKKSI